MSLWIMCLWRGAHRCPERREYWCTVYGALGTEQPSMASIYLMHRGFRR